MQEGEMKKLFLRRPHFQSNTALGLCQGTERTNICDGTLSVQSRKFLKIFEKTHSNMPYIVILSPKRYSKGGTANGSCIGDLSIFVRICTHAQAVTALHGKIFSAAPIKRRRGVFNMRKMMTFFPQHNSPNLHTERTARAVRSVFSAAWANGFGDEGLGAGDLGRSFSLPFGSTSCPLYRSGRVLRSTVRKGYGAALLPRLQFFFRANKSGAPSV